MPPPSPSSRSRGTVSCYPRSHFDSIGWAFLTVFQVLTQENWNNVMDDAIRSVGWPATAYFTSLMVMGNFVVLNLFLAILIGNFEGVEELIQVRTAVLSRPSLRRRRSDIRPRLLARCTL
jgi:hypothetical protein